MMPSRRFLVSSLALTLGASAAACSGSDLNDDQLRCGEGTSEKDGACLPLSEFIGGDGDNLGGSSGRDDPGNGGGTSNGGASNGGGTAPGSGGEVSSGGTDGSGGTDASGGMTSTGGVPGWVGELPPLGTEDTDCGSRDVTGATIVEGPITTNTEWSGLVHVVGDVSVRNEAVLTIAPGTKIIVGLGYEIEFGWEGSRPGLVAVGTEEEPIRFCGEADRPGYWEGITILPTTRPDSILRNVLISGGGSVEASSRAALVVGSPVHVMGVEVTNSTGSAVESEGGFSPESERLIVRDNAGRPGVITHSAGVRWPDGSEARDNAIESITLAFERFATSAEFIDVGAPYAQIENISGPGYDPDNEYRITFGPGVRIRTADFHDWSIFGATVEFNGTEEEPIFFGYEVDVTCDPSEPPYWCPPFLGNSRVTLGDTYDHVLRNVEFSGLEALDIQVQGNLLFENLRVLGGADYGLRLSGNGTIASESSGLKVVGLGRERLVVSSCSIFSQIPADSIVEGETQMDCSTLSGEVHNLGGPYFFEYGLNVAEGEALTIHPGVIALFDNNERVYVPATSSLTVSGTAVAPVVLGARLAFNEWTGLVIDSPNVSLDYAVIEYTGTQPAIYADTPFTLTNSVIRNTDGSGISKLISDGTDYSVSNTFENVAGANVVTH